MARNMQMLQLEDGYKKGGRNRPRKLKMKQRKKSIFRCYS